MESRNAKQSGETLQGGKTKGDEVEKGFWSGKYSFSIVESVTRRISC